MLRPVCLIIALAWPFSFWSCGPLRAQESSASTRPALRSDSPPTGPAVDFNLEIRPLLSDRCFACHGPDSENRQADLRLDREADAKAYAIEPGKPDDSEVYLRISAEDPDLRMPPADSNLSLSAEEQELIRRWIAQGAPWNEHWSFTPITPVDVPEVSDRKRNPIDAFVQARLESAGLTPAPEASRETLIRRLSFDLTGLPPTLAEVDEFVNDPAPDAYERLVDRLLASEHYGERMTSEWLDVARYSDSYGYQVDRDRYVWPWRDWVIRAFNRNLPYDEFLTQQLAGDLLPDATSDQILATTFNRLHPQKVEGGSTPEEFRVEYVSDRTQTFGTAFLGLTLECCRCHEHKYDPLAQAEYYQLSAFFDNIDEAGLYSYFTPAVPTPTLLLTDATMERKLGAAQRRVREAGRQLERVRGTRHAAFLEWLASDMALDSAQQACLSQRLAHLTFDDTVAAPNQSVPGKVGQAVRLTGDDGIGLDVGNFHRYDPFSVSLWLQTPDVKSRAVVFHRSRAWTDAGSRGYQLLLEDGCLSASLIHFWPGNALRVRTRAAIPVGEWLHVCMTYDGSSRAAGLRIYLNGQPADCEVVRDNLYKRITGGGGDTITIGERFRDRGFTNGLVDEFQVFERRLTSVEVRELLERGALVAALRQARDSAAAETDSSSRPLSHPLYDFYLSAVDEQYRQQLESLRAARKAHCELVDGVQEIMVMRELEQPRTTYLLRRGAYDARGEVVETDTPDVFPPFPADAPRNRLGLAQWLTRPDHPLTSRVAVNRYWQLLFGNGLVRTPEDFGSQGERPTHPHLLDWLAYDFMTHGWDLKRFLKQCVLSATYRQSSVVTPEHLKRDPENRLLARAPSYRLPAEMLRDNALAVSGLLVDRIGGPPARPYEVEVSFKPVQRDRDEGLYRRSLYTYWKRTAPAPVMMTLDASKRDVCRVRRERTSSPLQTFVLTNGPQFVESARVLSENVLESHDADTPAVLTELFRRLTSRHPTDEELQVLERLHARQLEYFAAHPDRADAYVSVGARAVSEGVPHVRLAACTAVANALFNFDDCVRKP